MSNTQKIILVVVVILLGAFVYSYNKSDNVSVSTPTPGTETESIIVGCYVYKLDQDVYTLNIKTQEGKNVTGTLAFKNFQKDSSSGTFVATYQDGILLGDYSFQSEGTNSVMQVIFQRVGDTFVRGFGEMNTTGDRFADSSNITFDPKQTFVSTPCRS